MANRRQIRESGSSAAIHPEPGPFPAAIIRIAILAVALAVLAALLPGLLAVDREQAPEYQVKAAFLLNFTKFIEWPASESAADAPFTICILGDDPFGAALDRTVEGERVNGRKLVVERISRQQSHSCQIIFAGRTEKNLGKYFASLGPGVLTVGESETFLREGGIIAFVIENHHVRFDINQGAAASASLKISSKLLNVARSVEK